MCLSFSEPRVNCRTPAVLEREAELQPKAEDVLPKSANIALRISRTEIELQIHTRVPDMSDPGRHKDGTQ